MAVALFGARDPLPDRIPWLVAALALATGPWWLEPLARARRRALRADAEAVVTAVWERASARMRGRVLAVSLAVMPLAHFANSMGLETVLDDTAASAARSTPTGPSWFRVHRGHFVTDDEIKQAAIYGACDGAAGVLLTAILLLSP